MKYILYSFIFFSSFVNSYSQEWTVKMDSLLRIAANEEIFHGQVLAAEDGQITFSNAYGKKEDGTAITKKTPLAIESVSKAFTALSILILQDRGLLKLDDKLTAYFPELPYKKVTIRSLLSMTSGLPRFQPTLEKYGDTTRTYSATEIIKLVSTYKPQAISPDIEFAYNGDNYVLLAAIVEKVTGTPFFRFLETNIFKPLQMNNTYVYKPEMDSLDIPALGEGYIYSTAEDLYKFEQSLYGNQLLSNELIEKSFEYTLLKNDSLSNYGFGWRLHKNDNVDEAYIVGDGTETRSSIQRYMNANKTLIYIHNISGSNWKEVYTAVRNIWEGKPFHIPKKRMIYTIDTKRYNQYVGKYLSDQFGLLHITKENDKLYLRPDPIPGKEELVPSSNTTFYFAEQALEWEFFLDEEGTVIGLGLKGRPETMGKKQ